MVSNFVLKAFRALLILMLGIAIGVTTSRVSESQPPEKLSTSEIAKRVAIGDLKALLSVLWYLENGKLEEAKQPLFTAIADQILIIRNFSESSIPSDTVKKFCSWKEQIELALRLSPNLPDLAENLRHPNSAARDNLVILQKETVRSCP
jgi:hypothetical protein